MTSISRHVASAGEGQRAGRLTRRRGDRATAIATRSPGRAADTPGFSLRRATRWQALPDWGRVSWCCAPRTASSTGGQRASRPPIAQRGSSRRPAKGQSQGVAGATSGGTSAGCAESRLSGSAVAEPSSAPTRSGPCSRKRAGDGGRSPGARPVLRMRRPLPAVGAEHARESASRNAPTLSALSAPRYADEANRGDARLVASAVHPIGARRARCDLGSRFPCPLRAEARGRSLE